MANDIIKVRSNERCNVIVPDFKKDEAAVTTIADEPRRLKISVTKKKNKTTGNVFTAVSGYVKLEAFDLDGKSEGVKVKKLTVRFRKDAFKGAINVHTVDELKSGYLYVKAKGIQVPPSYRVVEAKDEDGNIIYDDNGEAKLKYPDIWIQSDVIGLEEFVTSQSALDVDESSNVVDATYDEETGEVKDSEDYKQYNYDDPDETEETDIK